MKKLIADRAGKIDASGIRKVFALAASLEDPVNFSIGQPDFDVPEALKQEALVRISIRKRSGTQLSRRKSSSGCRTNSDGTIRRF